MTQATRDTVQVDPGGIRGGVVVAVALASVLVMALGVLLAWELERTSTATSSPHAGRFGAPPAEMSNIEMALFEPLRGGGVPRHAQAPRRPAREDAARGAREETVPTAGTDHAPAGDRAAQVTPERRLHSYGWSDRASGRIHIPISRAMELYLAREADGAEP